MMKNTAHFLLVIAVLLLAGCEEDTAKGEAKTTAMNPLIVIGIDGATWDVIDPMIAAGDLPNLSRLKNRGLWGPLIAVEPMASPVIWTSFGTGHFGRQHGILDFVYPYQPGPKRPVQSTERRRPALWNLASNAGRKVTVAGYFVTYPAETVNGTMISYNSKQRQPGADYPADALLPIRGSLDSIDGDEKWALWSRFLPWDFNPENPPQGDGPLAEAHRLISDRVEKRGLHAEYTRRAALYLADSPFDVFISYFGLVDFASHSLWKYYDDTDFETKADPEMKQLLGGVIPETYRFMDEFIGELLEKAPANANVIIVSDHGFGSATGTFSVAEHNRHLMSGNHRHDGIFIAAGPDISSGEIDKLTIIDVFPIMAYLTGLPVADDLPGDLDLRVFTADRLGQHPPSYVRAYTDEATTVETTVAASREAQEENVKSLQGLGYVGKSFELETNLEAADFDFWQAEDPLLVSHLSGELTFYLLKEDQVAASRVLADARANEPTLLGKILRRSRWNLQSVRDKLGDQAVPGSALPFIEAELSAIASANP
jgi:hypothetical protein